MDRGEYPKIAEIADIARDRQSQTYDGGAETQRTTKESLPRRWRLRPVIALKIAPGWDDSGMISAKPCGILVEG